MAARVRRYVYRGELGEHIPWGATHITVAEDVTFVRARAFKGHPLIVEIVCHDRVEKIEEEAFHNCPFLRRVIMPGVKIIERWAFCGCPALTDVECDKLEIIKEIAFSGCQSLRSIKLPFARIVGRGAFDTCTALSDVKFDSKLERIKEWAFWNCPSLERITLPLKDGIITSDDIFMECGNLRHIDLVEGGLQETTADLHFHIWRKDINEEIDSINQILPTTCAGGNYDYDEDDPGEKARVMRRWIRSVLGRIRRYREGHDRLLNETATTLQLVLPQDIATNNIVPFLELPYPDSSVLRHEQHQPLIDSIFQRVERPLQQRNAMREENEAANQNVVRRTRQPRIDTMFHPVVNSRT